jgi:uncharacterized protein (TIGR02001 family)
MRDPVAARGSFYTIHLDMHGNHEMRNSCWHLFGIAPLLLLAHTTTADAASVGGSIGASSDYVLRGISQNRGDPALQGDLHLQFAPHWSIGFWGSQLQLLPNRHSVELDSYLQWTRPLGSDFNLALSATHYAYPHDPRPINYDYHEFTAALSWRDQLYATVAYAPSVNLFTTHGYTVEHDKRVYTFELAAHRSLCAHLDALAGVGFYGPRDIDYASYTYGSASLVWHYAKWRADLSWIAVQNADHRWYNQGKAGGPLTLSLSWSFQQPP